MSGDILLNVGSGSWKSLGCNDLSAGKKFTLLLGSDKNLLSYSVSNFRLPMPVKIKTDVGFCYIDWRVTYMYLWSGWNILQSTHRYGSAINHECEESG